METADVVVVGLGAMGAQTLWRLARRGVDVLGVERFTPGHDRGSSHGQSRIIRTAYQEGAEYVPLVRAAWNAWGELERATGTELLLRCGTLLLGRSASVAGAVEAAERHGQPYQRLTAAEVTRRFPSHVTRADDVALLERRGGALRPEAAIKTAVNAATAAGARVWEGTTVTRVDPDPDTPRVHLDTTEIRARRVVVTAGAWLGRLLPSLAERLRVERRVMGWFPVTDPAAYRASRFPVFVRSEPDGTTWYGFPMLDGATVKIGVHAEGTAGEGEPADPDVGPRAPDVTDARRLSRLAGNLRGIAATPDRMAACVYTMTPDERFLIGRHPELPGLVLAGGFSGHGFKFASAVGMAAADLAEGESTDLPIAPFDPGRWA